MKYYIISANRCNSRYDQSFTHKYNSFKANVSSAHDLAESCISFDIYFRDCLCPLEVGQSLLTAPEQLVTRSMSARVAETRDLGGAGGAGHVVGPGPVLPHLGQAVLVTDVGHSQELGAGVTSRKQSSNTRTHFYLKYIIPEDPLVELLDVEDLVIFCPDHLQGEGAVSVLDPVLHGGHRAGIGAQLF